MFKTLEVFRLHYILIIVVGEIFMFDSIGKLVSYACVNGANVEKVKQTCNFCNSLTLCKVKT
jgi:hypothetical protein